VSDYVPFQLKESSRVRFNIVSGTWTAEDGSTTNFPFGVHQIHEEIVAPIVENLMNETRIERLKIYNHIKDQKISYLNKWHQDTEDFYGRNRAESADLINLMRASLRDYVAAYNTLTSLKKTEESMAKSGGSLDSTVVSTSDNSAELFAAFELQSKEFQNVQIEFETYMERLKEDIDLKAEKFEHIDYYDALLRDGTSKEIAVATDEVHDMESRRKPLITVNPLFAKTSDLPPAPSIEDITFEHISLNLPNIAKITLKELDDHLVNDTNESQNSLSNDLSSKNELTDDNNDISKDLNDGNIEDQFDKEKDANNEFELEGDKEGEFKVEEDGGIVDSEEGEEEDEFEDNDEEGEEEDEFEDDDEEGDEEDEFEDDDEEGGEEDEFEDDDEEDDEEDEFDDDESDDDDDNTLNKKK
jgi:hypothetical protein